MRAFSCISLTLCITLVAFIPGAVASCLGPTETGRQQFIQQWVADADVIADVEVVRRMDFHHRNAELLKMLKVYKGTPGALIALWIPAPTEQILTTESPTTGLPKGTKTFVILNKRPQGWIISECSASFNADWALSSQLKTLASTRR